MAFYTNAPPAYSAYPAAQQKFPIMDHFPRRPSATQQHPAMPPLQFSPNQPLTPDQLKYYKSYNRAVAIYNASPRKNYLACNHRGCTNIASTFSNLVIELQLHEIASSGTLCAICSNWFDSWQAKERHMCPGPGGFVPEDDPDMPAVAPPVQQMAAVDPLFFHQSMPMQQYAVIAARRALNVKRQSRNPNALRCDFHNCGQTCPGEAALIEHMFSHFNMAAGGLCAQCKQFCPNQQARDAHQCQQRC